MNDRFLNQMRREPRPEFARNLRARLRRQEDVNESRLAFQPALVFALAALAVALAFTFPPVRASAQAFLDLFRVRTFAALPIDTERMKALEHGKLDVKTLLADRMETLKEPGEPQLMPSAQAAGSAAGITVRVPSTLPSGLALERVDLQGEGAARLTVDVTRLRQVLEALEIRDVAVPEGIDGRTVTVRTAPVVIQRFRSGNLQADLLQARSPEVELPSGVDLARLGEIGLRIVGMDPAEARRFAQSIDWHSTMLVPVPIQGGAFREVEVRGRKGLLVTVAPGAAADRRPRDSEAGTILMWTEGDQVFALCGNLSGKEILEMANSIQ